MRFKIMKAKETVTRNNEETSIQFTYSLVNMDGSGPVKLTIVTGEDAYQVGDELVLTLDVSQQKLQ
jgi:hypothetical protein